MIRYVKETSEGVLPSPNPRTVDITGELGVTFTDPALYLQVMEGRERLRRLTLDIIASATKKGT